MKWLGGPLLEISFYFGDEGESLALARLIKAVLSLGATFAGTGQGHCRPGVGIEPFASWLDELPEAIDIRHMDDLLSAIQNPDIRLTRVLMYGASGLTLKAKDTPEIVTYQSISPEAMSIDSHPVAIFTEGELFSGSSSKSRSAKARKAGRIVYERFITLNNLLKPSYSAITSEYALECPDDLLRCSGSTAFRDFYMSQSYIGETNIRLIANWYQDAYIKLISDGIYISTWEYFNPDGKMIDVSLAEDRSYAVAKLIASKSRRRGLT